MRYNKIEELVKLVEKSNIISLTYSNWFYSIRLVKNALQPHKLVSDKNYLRLRSGQSGIVHWYEHVGNGAEVFKGESLGFIDKEGSVHYEIRSPADGIVKTLFVGDLTEVSYKGLLAHIEVMEKP